MSDDEYLKPVLSSHAILSASRPFFAAQKLVARTATPFGTSTTNRTPGTLDVAVASSDLSAAPKRGGCATTAVSMSESFTSCVNCAVPFDLARASLRGAFLPISVKFFGSLSGTFSGTGIAAAAAASWPKLALRAPALSTPSLTVMLCGDTFHCLAAAATSIARAVAPALRSWSHEFAIAVDPPVPCIPKARFL